MHVETVEYSRLKENWSPSRYLLEPPDPDYPVRRITDIVDINPESRLLDKDEHPGEIKVIEISSVDKLGKVIKATDYEKDKLSRKVRLKAFEGDVLIPVIQSRNYSPVVIEDNFLVSDNYAVLVPKGVSPYYLYWALSEEYVQRQIDAMSRGSVISRLPYSSLKEIKIPWLAGKEREDKISEVESNFRRKTPDELAIEYKRKIDMVMRSTFHYQKKDISNETIKGIRYRDFSNSDEWRLDLFLSKDIKEILPQSGSVKILPLSEVINYISPGVNFYKVKQGKEEVGVLKARDVKVLIINQPSETEMITKDDIKEFLPSDIIMRRKGGVGPAAVVEEVQNNTTYDDNIVRIVANKNVVIPAYLAIYLNSDLGEYLIDKYVVSKTMKYIKISDLKKVKVVVPDLDTQKEIVTQVMG